MTILHTIILGIVEGITEFLPISSTGHLILTAELLKIEKTAFLSSFEIGIQLGAILSVVVLYWNKIWKERSVFRTVTLAFIPTAFFGLLFYKFIKQFLFGNAAVVLWSLFLGGIVLIIFEKLHKEKEITDIGQEDELGKITNKQAIGIGLFQCLAMVPGVSRAASTIIGGLIVGLRRKTVVEFSFLLAIPTMVAATGLDLLQTGFTFSGYQWFVLITGFLISFVVALFSIKFLLKFIQKHTFVAFGVYRIVLATAFWFFIIR